MVTFDVQLLSTGHGGPGARGSGGGLPGLMELIKHRLDEAYLPGVGPLEPNESYIRMAEESIQGRQCL